ncbi:hypothetical protein C1H76_9123 [Elsinoe australis]|uniref:Smr domain-containing protein n=1 Tax=Elsinoe australis TaxID=40998 RepID=A0A4U7ANB4_9PEZI|nr:hypothetical protein C1H76_9123 [Elsinoe australis]
MGEQISQLEAEYCPPLDTSVLLAIISDYDLSNTESFSEARAILDSIKIDAEAEQAASDFTDSGTADHSPSGHAPASSSHLASESEETDVTNLSNGLSKLRATSNSPHANDHVDDAALSENLDDDTKIELLQSLVPSVSDFTVKYTLKKCDSNLHRALDELLNISSFENADDHEGAVPSKGIDAFTEDHAAKRGRKKKRKGANQKLLYEDRRSNSLPSSSGDHQPAATAWKSAERDVQFLVTHTKLSDKTVKTAYNLSGASVPKTISHLLDDMASSAAKVTSSNTTVQANAVELGRDFPSISPAHLTALIQLTHPSTSSAHALARALATPTVTTSSGPIIPQYKSLSLSDDESSSISSPSPSLLRNDPTSSQALALSHREAHRLLTTQAAAAYRRSRSNHLYGGAAAYYADRAREQASTASAYNSAAADAQVAAQSSADQLDLHGTFVADAVRIAKRETAAWWAGLGEARINGRVGAAERDRGFRIVVGRGTHSEGGKSRIGPAVVKALSGEGWKVEVGIGVVTVRGKGRG